MTWCNDSDEEERGVDDIITPTIINAPTLNNGSLITHTTKPTQIRTITCSSCGHSIDLQDQGGIHELPGLPAGVKFDPNEQEILEHLEAKVVCDVRKLHPLIDEFIPTLEGENGICYTHPEKLPGVSKDGQIRHFFHRPSKAYTTGTRKRRKVQTDEEGSETRWHKTGKTRPVLVGGAVKGFKKILVLYTNYGRQRKPEKTNWVMHQYHLGSNEEEKDGELVVSKVFFQTQPRHCAAAAGSIIHNHNQKRLSSNNYNDHQTTAIPNKEAPLLDYYNHSPYISYDHILAHDDHNNRESSSSPQLIPNLVVQADHDHDHDHHASSFIRLAMDANKARLQIRK